MVLTCCAVNCLERYRKGSRVSFHSFPIDPALNRKWCENLKSDCILTQNSKICSKHFTKECYHGNKKGVESLKKEAVPSTFEFQSGTWTSPQKRERPRKKCQRVSLMSVKSQLHDRVLDPITQSVTPMTNSEVEPSNLVHSILPKELKSLTYHLVIESGNGDVIAKFPLNLETVQKSLMERKDEDVGNFKSSIDIIECEPLVDLISSSPSNGPKNHPCAPISTKCSFQLVLEPKNGAAVSKLINSSNKAIASYDKVAVTNSEDAFINVKCDHSSGTKSTKEIMPVTVSLASHNAVVLPTTVLKTVSYENVMMPKNLRSNFSGCTESDRPNNDPSEVNEGPSASENTFPNQATCSVNQVSSLFERSSFPSEIPILTLSGMTEKVTLSNSFSIKASPLILPPSVSQNMKKIDASNCVDLRSRLEKENFLKCPVIWLVKLRLIPDTSVCRSCSGINSILHPDKDYFDKYCWICTNPNCMKKRTFTRPKFYSRFGFSLSDLIAATYHWALQSNLESILKDTTLSIEEIRFIWHPLQELCSKALSKLPGKIGGDAKMNIVEVTILQFGKFYIFAAMERKTRYTRLKAFPVSMDFQSWHCLKELQSWLKPNSYVVSSWNNFKGVEEDGLSEKNVPTYKSHNMNISQYLEKQMVAMFGKFSTESLKIEDFQGYLDELQWRERFGYTSEMAFWNILNLISGDQYLKYTKLPLINCELITPGSAAYNSSVEKNTILKRSPRIAASKSLSTEITEEMQFPEQKLVIKKKCESNISVLNGSINTYSRAKQISKPENSTDGDSNSKNGCLSSVRQSSKTSLTTQPVYTSSVPIVPEGKTNITADHLLRIQTWPVFYEKRQQIKKRLSALELKTKLKLEKFFSCPVKWLIKHNYVPDNSPCEKCSRKSFILQPFKRSRDGYSWLCMSQNCQSIQPFRRPDFLEKFGFSLSELLTLIFHWTVQTSISSVMQGVNLDNHNIRCVFSEIQEFCTGIILKKHCKLGNNNQIVEVAVVQFGKFFILGAMERKSKMTRLIALPVSRGYKSALFQKKLEPWLDTWTTVITPFSDFSIKKIKLVHIIAGSSAEMNTDNITKHLQKLMTCLFGKFCTDNIKCETIQKFLDEVQWRERFDSTEKVDAAFWNIFNQIAEENKIGVTPFQANGNHVTVDCQVFKDSSHDKAVENLELVKLIPPVKRYPCPKLFKSPPAVCTTENKNYWCTFNVHQQLLCIECNNLVNQDHFLKFISCYCNYSTHCSNAFLEHMLSRHSEGNDNNIEIHNSCPVILQNKGFCSCGFSSKDGNKLASHLVECGKSTCKVKLMPPKPECVSPVESMHYLQYGTNIENHEYSLPGTPIIPSFSSTPSQIINCQVLNNGLPNQRHYLTNVKELQKDELSDINPVNIEIKPDSGSWMISGNQYSFRTELAPLNNIETTLPGSRLFCGDNFVNSTDAEFEVVHDNAFSEIAIKTENPY